MHKPEDLTYQELITIVARLQQALYLDVDEQNRPVWNPDKSWEAADILDDLARLLVEYTLAPVTLIEADVLLS